MVAHRVMTSRRFPAPWQVEQTPGGFKVRDANGQALVYVYARETPEQASIANVLTLDEARRIAVNVARPGSHMIHASPQLALFVVKFIAQPAGAHPHATHASRSHTVHYSRCSA